MSDSIKNSYYLWSELTETVDITAQALIELFGVAESIEKVLTNSFDKKSVVIINDFLQENGYTQSQFSLRRAQQRWESRIDRISQLDLKVLGMQEEKYECNFIFPYHSQWPGQLNDLSLRAPVGLWIKGKLKFPAVAIVGARAATSYGKHCAADISSGLALEEISIISGGAYGIDAAAHRAAISVGGHTTCVFAGGFGHMYPQGNILLFSHIIEEGGCLISELSPENHATKWRFLQRNRLIAALSNMVVVIEAGWKSGARNTVNHAYEMQRPLAAVPGPITSPMSVGTHEMLKDGSGAYCVTSAQDILELIGPIAVKKTTIKAIEPFFLWTCSEENRVLDVLCQFSSPLTLDFIAAEAGLSHNVVMKCLKNLYTAQKIYERNGLWKANPALERIL